MNRGSSRDLSDAFVDFLSAVARFLMWGGIVTMVISIALLIYTAMAVSDPSLAHTAQATANVLMAKNVLLAGTVAGGVGTTYLFWGEDILGAIQLLVAALLYFAPLILPSAGIKTEDNKVAQAALEAMQVGGVVLGAMGILVLVIDLGGKARQRLKQGSKADQLKYGKGVREEHDRQNVFLGKCYQLPFCRKFVREKCPIYHARRTCWKEQVGCMCEEEVIRNAMENKPIPKDALLASNMIPKNNKLTSAQKFERCKTCVIYNEHQKHKYKAALPTVLIAFGLLYFLGRGPLLELMGNVVKSMDQVVGRLTFRTGGNIMSSEAGGTFVEVLLVAVMIVLFAYAMKLLEYLIFKLKV